MGLFDKIFNSEKEENKEKKGGTPWIELNSINQLDEIEKISVEKTVAILKHSTRCGVSRMVLRMFETDYDLDENEPVELYFLDLITYREISNEIASRFRVQHESPQLIVLKNREVVHHSSHQGISANKLKELV
ncbi:bacillithiol system redox-active protein YtxJ [Christiangramia sabulilitoris]|uniref:Bacillithiol system redox-active protein YtxJ n=1 Tax=Christiangramia sabulilitoris TaxID=2583991 RepID=A0A550I2V7_9FLAO|nr:bacillithiol system redox-active protein YtxJ [Christiangramia sabulilitoris]TRO65307.1 bacillithiol system redox-active protein YtxJ [Christiangramia sabulilitoris]